MAEGVLFDVAGRLAEMLVSSALKEIGLLCGVKDEFQKLVATTNTIKSVLLDAEEKMAVNEQVNVWLKKLGDAFFVADDLVDKFRTQEMRYKVMSGNKFTREVRVFFSSSNQLVFRFKMGHQIKNIREKLDCIKSDRSFHLIERLDETIVEGGSSMRETCSYVGEGEVIGREDEKKEIIRLLVDMEFEEDVSFIPIVGFGGLGKTTLAQYVFNDEKVQNHFQLKTWVCVSDVFDVKLLVGKIIESNNQGHLQLEQLQNQLRQKLSGKKYLLVLDDVWNEDGEKWSKLEMLLKCGGKGSRVLITTRSDMVARITRTVRPLKVKGLSKDVSWSLFKRMAFEKDQEPVEGSKMMELGMQVVEKCKGVPLAIRTMGRLLQVRLWKSRNPENDLSKFISSEFAEIDQNHNDILPTLKLSYNHLPSQLKHCFAYCTLFPKDHIIDVEELIQLWMAQGFIKCSLGKDQSPEDIGYEYFKNLLWRSFFQEARMNDSGGVKSCKMHDLMHDLAVSVARSDSVIIDQTTKNYEGNNLHMSLVNFDLETHSLRKIFEFFSQPKRIRTFIKRDCRNLSFSKLQDCLAKLKCLRALSLERMDIEVLPKNLCGLEHLRYLNLSNNSRLKTLPSSLIRLQNLHTLKLKFCFALVRLPQDMKKLVNLRHLMIEGCRSLTEMPPKFGYMTSLHTLDLFVVSKSTEIDELSNLINNLQGCLTIENLRHTNHLLVEGKCRLHSLKLEWGSNDEVETDDEMLAEGLQPPSSLKKLVIYNFMGVRFGGWRSPLGNLVKLKLIHCDNCQYLPKLDQLRFLKRLEIMHVEVEYMCSSAEDDDFDADLFFPSLVNLEIRDCPNLKWWWWKRGLDGNEIRSFPRLSHLEIFECPNLTSMPLFPRIESIELNGSSAKTLEEMWKMMSGIRNIHGVEADNTQPNFSFLNSITINDCHDLTSLLEGIGNLPSLQSVDVRKCSNLTSLFEGIVNLPSLQSVNVSKCSNLTSLLQGIGDLPSLQSIDVYECSNLTSILKEIGNLPSLQSVRIICCSNLTSLLEGIENFPSLQSINIIDCSNLTSISDNLSNCKELNIRGFPKWAQTNSN